MSRVQVWLFGVLFAGAGVVLLYALRVRPWDLRWGATNEEIARQSPGDLLTPHSAGGSTGGITIHARASEVWKWIVQIGQDRAGYYSYSWLENVFRSDMHNAYHTEGAWQNRAVGDEV